MVIKEQAQTQQPSRAKTLVVGQDKAQRPNEMWSNGPERFALHERFTNKPEFIVLEIAKAAVY
jgi:hypothetical protein